jgi:hypothetical protein
LDQPGSGLDCAGQVVATGNGQLLRLLNRLRLVLQVYRSGLHGCQDEISGFTKNDQVIDTAMHQAGKLIPG